MERREVDFPKAVAAYGGFTALAKRLGVSLSTCHGWSRRARVRKWRLRETDRVVPFTRMSIKERPDGSAQVAA